MLQISPYHFACGKSGYGSLSGIGSETVQILVTFVFYNKDIQKRFYAPATYGTLRTLPNKALFQNVDVLKHYLPVHRAVERRKEKG